MASIVSAGTTSATALNMSADTSGVLQLASNNGTVAITVDTSQNVGVGVTPSATTGSGVKGFEIGGVGNGLLGNSANVWATQNVYFGTGFKKAGAGYATMYNQSGGTHNWNVSTTSGGAAGDAITFTQAMTLDASGNLGVGTTSPAAKLDAFQASTGTYFLGGGGDNKARQLAIKSSTTTNSGDTHTFDAQSGTGILAFATTGSERARIDSYGSLLVGTTSGNANQYSAGSLNLGGSIVTAGYKYCIISYNNGGSGAAVSFQKAAIEKAAMFYNESDSRLYVFNGNSATGVYMSNNATSWTANSDERLKTDLVPIENAAQKVSTLRAVTGRFKTDEEGVSRSFLIAQDVQAVLPEAVDASDPEKLGVQYTDVIPLLVAAIKEQQALITQLQADVAALKGA